MAVEPDERVLLHVEDRRAGLRGRQEGRDREPVGDVAVIVDDEAGVRLLDRVDEVADAGHVAHAGHVLDAQHDLVGAAAEVHDVPDHV